MHLKQRLPEPRWSPFRFECAAKATAKLRQFVAGGGLELSLVPCACLPGTEGTQACNYGRSCGVLKVTGKDVAKLLIADGLARPFHCSRDRCPRGHRGAGQEETMAVCGLLWPRN